MADEFSNESDVSYEAVCQSCGHTIDLPEGNKYYRGKCPVCNGVMSVEMEKAANMKYLCLSCGFEKKAKYDFDMITECPVCRDTLKIIDFCGVG